MPTPAETVIATARDFLGERITTNATLREHHSHGQDTQPPVLPDAVAFVETTEEAARLLALCNTNHVPVVAWGAGTSLEGHVTPVRGGITLDLSRMTRVIDVRDGFTKAQVFKIATDYLTSKYSVDVSDAHAGFLMTPWQNSIVRAGAPDLRYRTRLIIRVTDDGKQASIRSEANWQRGENWDIGYDAQMLEDAVIEMRTRVGKTS